MTADKLHDALTLLPSDLIAEADRKRSRKPRVIHWHRYAAMAACLCLILFSTFLFRSGLFSRKGAMESMKEAPMEFEAAAAAPEEFSAGSGSTVAGNRSAFGEASPEEGISTDDAPSALPTAPASIQSSTTSDAAPYATHQVATPSVTNSAVNFAAPADVLLITSRTQLEAYWEHYALLYDFTAMRDYCDTCPYDDTWFETHDLLLNVISGTQADIPWTVTSIEDVRETDTRGYDWFIHLSNQGVSSPDQEETTLHLLTPLEKGLIPPEAALLPISDAPSQ